MDKIPVEIIAKILKFFQISACEELKLVSHKFYQAYKLLPYRSIRFLLDDLYDGDMDTASDWFITNDYEALAHINEVLSSKEARELMARQRVDQLLSLFVIKNGQQLEQNGHIDPVESYYSARQKVFYYLQNESLANRNGHFTVLKHASRNVFNALLGTRNPNESQFHFSLALKYGNIKTAIEFLEECRKMSQAPSSPLYYSSFDWHFNFQSAFFEFPLETLKLLFYPRSAELNHANYGFYAVKYSLAFTSTDKETALVSFLLEALSQHHIDLRDWYKTLVCWLAFQRDPSVLDTLLAHPMLNPNDCDLLPLRICIRNKDISSFSTLLSDSRINPSCNNNLLVVDAIRQEAQNVLRILLKDPNVNPSYPGNYPLMLATNLGYGAMIEILLNSKQVCDAMNGPEIFWMAAAQNQVKLLKQLIRDPRIRVSRFQYDRAIDLSLEYQCFESTTWLLKHRNCDPSANNHAIFRMACRHRYWKVVKLFLEDSRVDPSARDNIALDCVYQELYGVRFNTRKFYKNYHKNEEILEQSKRYNSPLELAIQIGKMLVRDARVLYRIRQMFPKRSKNYGFQGSIFEKWVS